MKLSEAIRQGSKVARRQVNGDLFEWDEKGNLVGACVLGAACLGSGIQPKARPGSASNARRYYTALRKLFPVLKTKITDKVIDTKCNCGDPECGQPEKQTLESYLIDLNDDLEKPRYKIAHWLERKGL